MVSSFSSCVDDFSSRYSSIISIGSNIIGTLGSLYSSFEAFDQWSGYISGGIDGWLGFFGPNGFGFNVLKKYSTAFKKFGIGMIIASNVFSWVNSVYNNFTNPNYTTGEAFVASAMDAAYYTFKGIVTYFLGKLVTKLVFASGIAVGCATLGLTIFGTTIGFIGALAIGGAVSLVVGFVGAVAIYYLGELIDYGWEWLKKQIFE